ncbi:TfoX/Sxy family protein [Hyphomicrobium sp. DY-1]|uniref:TfoX/Sxy family protein n=1 Tax=Hyphomicrobium sp. DY-1 TaxID=3075650 RepID=UPI0039C479EB
MSSANDDLLQILKDALEREGFVRGGRMFGGVGVYFDGTFFAIITGGTIYLKTSEGMRARFEAERSQPFSYQTKSGRTQLTSYWRLPERLLDDVDELRDWARASIDAAREFAASKQRKPTTAKPEAERKTKSVARSSR